MKIKYGSRLTPCHMIRAFLLGFLLYLIIGSNVYFQSNLGELEKSILQSRNITVTERPAVFYCDLPYDDCLCSVITHRSNTSDKCVTYAVLVGSRVLSSMSFFLQIVLVREIFSISTDHPRAVIYTLRIISLFAFIGVTISIYWNSCCHAYVTVILSFTGTSLSLLGIFNAVHIRARLAAFSNSNQIVVVQKLEKDDKEGKSWQELI